MTEYVNNHIHTTYSFSPYSPAMAVVKAKENGLITAGIMDHDSISGAAEFIESSKKEGIAATVGFECRIRMESTPFFGRRINNPDQMSVAYVTCHGVPHQHIDTVNAWLTPYRNSRNVRNRKMVQKINDTILSKIGLHIDFDKDVADISMFKKGGSITERHITYALVEKLFQYFGKGEKLVAFLEGELDLSLSEKQVEALLETHNPYYDYVLLGIIKSTLIESFYIDATDECPMAEEFLWFARSVGAIPAYSYLGDVTDSVTGDKKAQQFEDSFLDELFPWAKEAGFLAITYMPTRNTKEQLQKIIRLCNEYDFFQISGEDINSPMQGFRCAALELPEYKHLVTSTWALIGHEKAASVDLENGMFSWKTMQKTPNLQERIQEFALLGKE